MSGLESRSSSRWDGASRVRRPRSAQPRELNHVLDKLPLLRDLGGLQAGEAEWTAPGHLFRSAALDELAHEDLAVLRQGLGLATVVDLRSPREVELDGVGAVDRLDLSYHRIPLVTDVLGAPGFNRSDTLLRTYGALLEHGAPSVLQILALAADPERHALLVHCTAGKDRTGVVIALLLDLLGVSRSTIVNDYTRTQNSHSWLLSFLARRPSLAGRSISSSNPRLNAYPQTLVHFLSLLDDQYGGAKQYVLDAGGDASLIQQLRRSLVQFGRPPSAASNT